MAQSDVLESLQKRAMNVILTGVDYTTALIIARIDTLRDRREKLTRRFFTRHVLDETSCLHYLAYFHQSAMAISLQDSEKLDYSRTTEQKQTDSITHSFPIAQEIFNN